MPIISRCAALLAGMLLPLASTAQHAPAVDAHQHVFSQPAIELVGRGAGLLPLDARQLIGMLDKAGIACSTKSSCMAGEENSYVVESLGGEKWRARNTLRFTFSPETTRREINKIITILKKL